MELGGREKGMGAKLEGMEDWEAWEDEEVLAAWVADVWVVTVWGFEIGGGLKVGSEEEWGGVEGNDEVFWEGRAGEFREGSEAVLVKVLVKKGVGRWGVWVVVVECWVVRVVLAGCESEEDEGSAFEGGAF